ncbi:MAG: hypothetical protein IPM82_07405 [Saprospiraceae bacterium]|nr:hypothetical protein [Saprospiraceae bacterium]
MKPGNTCGIKEKGRFLKTMRSFSNGTVKVAFSLKGTYRRLNWLWFGALGGLVSWVFALSGKITLPWLRELLSAGFDTDVQISTALYDSIFLGAAMGFGITLALSIVEEMGQSRMFSFWRILLRCVIAIVLGMLIFFLQELLTAKVLPNNNYLGHLLGWTIFGTVIGLICTLLSTIELKSGLIGGLIAGIVAVHIYYPLVYSDILIRA